MCCIFSAATMRGARRDNQDNMRVDSSIPYVDPECDHTYEGMFKDKNLHLFCICDGIGGELFGDLASINALDAVDKSLLTVSPDDDLGSIVNKVVQTAQNRVLKLYKRLHSYGGTTITVLAIRGNKYHLLNIGDSPAYLYSSRNNTVLELSVCHNLSTLKKQIGVQTSRSESSVLVSYLGHNDVSRPMLINRKSGKLNNGDRLLLCTDGVSDAFDSEQLEKMIASGCSAGHIVKIASERKDSDNCTAITLSFEKDACFAV